MYEGNNLSQPAGFGGYVAYFGPVETKTMEEA